MNEVPSLSGHPFEEAEMLLSQYEREPEHVRHVAALAGQLFDGLTPCHGRGEPERTLLLLGALLHDIGNAQTPDGSGHHKESARLIAAFPWKSLVPAQVAVVAQIARYHRRTLPQPHHEGFQALPPHDRETVRWIAGILRVADALDRKHVRAVQEVSVFLPPGVIELRVRAAGPCAEELGMVVPKGDLLELASGRRVIAMEVA